MFKLSFHTFEGMALGPNFIMKIILDILLLINNIFIFEVTYIITSTNTTNKTYFKYEHYYDIISDRRMFDLLH
jgi:hypothetical protein